MPSFKTVCSLVLEKKIFKGTTCWCGCHVSHVTKTIWKTFIPKGPGGCICILVTSAQGFQMRSRLKLWTGGRATDDGWMMTDDRAFPNSSAQMI